MLMIFISVTTRIIASIYISICQRNGTFKFDQLALVFID